jgi:hypothetical protein
MMKQVTLHEIVAQKPLVEYRDWWPMGETFVRFMSVAIIDQMGQLLGSADDYGPVTQQVEMYLDLVYGQDSRPGLVSDFISRKWLQLQSGEFDALSYGFFWRAFELIAHKFYPDEEMVAKEKRLFTKRVGERFFDQVQIHLQLDLPVGLESPGEFAKLRGAIDQVGQFLDEENYLRDSFEFTFDVDVEHAGRRIVQLEVEFIRSLVENGVGHAFYIMGYPAILPSAIYLYNTMGEAQHHSSRIIEELFSRVGYEARETDDFDPTGFPADRVVELWNIRKR